MDAHHCVSSSAPKPRQPQTIPLKAPVSALAFAQLGLAVIQTGKNIVNIIKRTEEFYHAETKQVLKLLNVVDRLTGGFRTTIQVIFGLTVIWILIIFILLVGLFTNRHTLILVHLIFCVFYFLFELFSFIILLVVFDDIFQILLVLFSCTVLGLSIHYERLCFIQMKHITKDFNNI